MRKCFELVVDAAAVAAAVVVALPLLEDSLDRTLLKDLTMADFPLDDVGVGSGGKLVVMGLNMVSSDLIIRSGGSRTAESTSKSVISCKPGVTSIGFQSSSSTSFADFDIRI
jgi:hypothetical protein